MDGQLDGLKQWKCKNGHVLGIVQRARSEDGQGRSWHICHLMLFRHAIDLSLSQPEEVDVIGTVEGTMHVRCDVPGCGEVRPWEIGADALERLMEAILPGKKIATPPAAARNDTI